MKETQPGGREKKM